MAGDPHADCVDVAYCVTRDLGSDEAGAFIAQLSPEERDRHQRFAFERDRRDYAAAHALLRWTLSAHADRSPADWRFVSGARGKPLLPPELAGTPALTFNLSHTHGLVACVVARGCDVGIDVERIDRAVNVRRLARRLFSPAEIAQVERADAEGRAARFIEIWTLKEAYVKATGDGLACPLDRFGFELEGPEALRFHAPSGEAEWTFALFAPLPEFRLSVAVRDRGRRFRVARMCDAGRRWLPPSRARLRQTC